MKRNWRLAILFSAVVCMVFLIPLPSSSQEGKKIQNGGYAGAETCKGCHDDFYSAFKKDTPHWRSVVDPKGPAGKKGCESCHGPGEKHAEAEGKGFIFSFKGKSAMDRSEPCLMCHQKQKDLFQFRRGVHQLSAVGCNDCHQIHGAPVASLLRKKETDLCFSCHQEVRGKFYLPNNHRVLQGAVKCTDCHTPHGTRTRASLRKWNKFNEDVCFKCHPEKRGPWVFEHLAVKAEGCSICHVPHGSPNRFLLTARDTRRVCIQCHGQRHINPRLCTNCHTQIHGSNFSSRFFQ
jgi:DmsE family decaheme c-type cytochrome